MENLKAVMDQIPESEEIYNAMVTDWVLNADSGELENTSLEEWADLVRGTYQDQVRFEQGNNIQDNDIIVPFNDQQYLSMLNAFKAYVRHVEEEREGQEGGKRRKRRHSKPKRRQTKKKSRRGPKKTRKHK
jgi:hypothetical protein